MCLTWVLPGAEMAETGEQEQLISCGCYGDVLEFVGKGRQDQMGEDLRENEIVASEQLGELEWKEN